MHSIVEDIGTIIIIAAIVGLISYRFKQPILLGYLVTGVIVGPLGFELVKHLDNIKIISEIGLILLLFITGLELNPASLLSSGKKLMTAGVGQFILCVLYGLLFFPLLVSGGPGMETLYLSLLCALSSTAIVVKALNDKFELDTLHGKISVGVLIIQDLWAIIILAFQPNFDNFQISIVALALFKSFLLVAFGFLFSKHILKRICASVNRAPEMILSIAIGWCALVAWLAGVLGLSIEMGALIAGLSISSFPYSIHITAKTQPLRDFFMILFFVSLGMQITMPDTRILILSGILTTFIILTRFLSIVPLLLFSGSGPRTAFITSLNLSQLSEFALVIAAIGLKMNHISENIFNLLIYTMALSSILSSYFIKFNYPLYGAVEKWLKKRKWFSSLKNETEKTEEESPSIILLGLHRGARALLEILEDQLPQVLNKILVVDFNTELIHELRNKNIHALFGDISHSDTLEHAEIKKAKIIISTIPDLMLKGTSNLNIVKTCRTLTKEALILATADTLSDAEILRKAGADEVVLPHSLAGQFIADYLSGAWENSLEKTNS